MILRIIHRGPAELRRQASCLSLKRRATKDFLTLLEISYLFGRYNFKASAIPSMSLVPLSSPSNSEKLPV